MPTDQQFAHITATSRLPLIEHGIVWLHRVMSKPGHYLMIIESEEYATFFRGMAALFGADSMTQYVMRKLAQPPQGDKPGAYSVVRLWLEENQSPQNLMGGIFDELWCMNPHWAIPELTWYYASTRTRGNPGTIFEQGQQITAQ